MKGSGIWKSVMSSLLCFLEKMAIGNRFKMSPAFVPFFIEKDDYLFVSFLRSAHSTKVVSTFSPEATLPRNVAVDRG